MKGIFQLVRVIFTRISTISLSFLIILATLSFYNVIITTTFYIREGSIDRPMSYTKMWSTTLSFSFNITKFDFSYNNRPQLITHREKTLWLQCKTCNVYCGHILHQYYNLSLTWHLCSMCQNSMSTHNVNITINLTYFTLWWRKPQSLPPKCH